MSEADPQDGQGWWSEWLDAELPPVPEHVAQPMTDERLAWSRAAHDADLIERPAPDLFEAEFGLPWHARQHVPEAPTTEEVAVLAQEAAVRMAQVSALAEAHRITAVLSAYECAIEDLEVRYGSSIGHRGGLGAQAFFRSLGLQLKQHPHRIAHDVDAALILRDRLPVTWDVFLRGGSSWSRAAQVAAAADGLDREHWAGFDAVAARLVCGSDRLKHDLRVARERLQADTAAARVRATHERRSTTLELGHDGEASLVITGPAAVLVACNDALHRAAVAAHGVAGETRGIGQLRHDLALDLLDEGLLRGAEPSHAGIRVPGRKRVDVTLVLTVPALAWLGKTPEQAVLDGVGPISMEVAKDLAADAPSFLRVLTDPVTGVRLTMDRTTYSPPADLARWVRIRDGRSRFPGATRPAHLCDIDHAREWQHDGTTDAANLITLDRPAHNLKTAGLFQEQLLDTGIVGWTDAWRRWFEDPPPDPLEPVPPSLLPPSPTTADAPPPF